MYFRMMRLVQVPVVSVFASVAEILFCYPFFFVYCVSVFFLFFQIKIRVFFRVSERLAGSIFVEFANVFLFAIRYQSLCRLENDMVEISVYSNGSSELKTIHEGE